MKCLHQRQSNLCKHHVAGLLAPSLHPDPAAAGREQHHQHPGPPLQGAGQWRLVRVHPGDQGRQAPGQESVRVPGVRAQALLPAQAHHPHRHRSGYKIMSRGHTCMYKCTNVQMYKNV